MKTVDEARRDILARIERLSSVRVLLPQALGLVLAEPVLARSDNPRFTNSAMDGYAVRWTDVEAVAGGGRVRLPVAFEVAAGDEGDYSLPPQAAARIMTGAPLPASADTVVMREDTDESSRSAVIVLNVPEAGKGANIRFAGAFYKAGEPLLRAGQEIGPAAIGLLASEGLCALSVVRRPRIAVVSTGDELVDLGEPIGPGQIRNSSAYMLQALIRKAGGEPVVCGIGRDTVDSCRARFEEALGSADMVVSIGGVSVGDYDVVRAVLDELGADIGFWKVKMKPGKPLSFGTVGDTPMIGLPGNPVSSYVCFYQFVWPAIRRAAGHAEAGRLDWVRARLTENVRSPAWRADFQRGVLTSDGAEPTFQPFPDQSSANQMSSAVANAFGIVPEGVGSMEAGEWLEVERIPG